MKKTISEELKKFLEEKGADIIGFANISTLKNAPMPYGICIGIKIPKNIIISIKNGPNKLYYDIYNTLNNKLDTIVKSAEFFLKEKGFAAYAQTTSVIKKDKYNRTPFPHKTVAVHSGIGWIGKSSLLVTEQYGSAVRISSLFTNAPLECRKMIEPKCNNCQLCQIFCPADAILGKIWSEKIDRDELLDSYKCRNKMLEISKKNFKIEAAICGKCIFICPYTQRYIKQAVQFK